MISDAARRSILRWIHIMPGIPIIGYIYSPVTDIAKYAAATRFVFTPVILLSGLWLWKGQTMLRLFSKRPGQ